MALVPEACMCGLGQGGGVRILPQSGHFPPLGAEAVRAFQLECFISDLFLEPSGVRNPLGAQE